MSTSTDPLMKQTMIHGVESFLIHIKIKYDLDSYNVAQTKIDIEEWKAKEFGEVTK